jgi:hypothetical protein
MFHGIAGNDDTILGIRGPTIKQLARNTALQHTRGSKDDRRPRVIETLDINGLEVLYEMEMKGIANVHLGPNPDVHHVGIGLIDAERARGQFAGVPNGYVLQLRIGLPIFIQDQQQFL